MLDASLEPIQLGQLSGAIGWPAFSGTLSGRLPLLTLAANTITVGGTLSANAFDGSIEMSDLRIEQPFSRVPRLQADMTLRNLDLKRLTDAFSFGLIQGRLSADVAGLQLQNWRPVAMDLHIYTPEDDDSRHRISQRAVENLASVGGGGAGAALSSGFLQFFEVFAYDRIGLRCRLANGNLCHEWRRSREVRFSGRWLLHRQGAWNPPDRCRGISGCGKLAETDATAVGDHAKRRADSELTAIIESTCRCKAQWQRR